MSDKPLADKESPAFKVAAEDHPAIKAFLDQPPPVPGQSVGVGLKAVPDSFAQPTAKGEPVPHVFGPGQSAVDPIAAGLDPNFKPLTRAENRAITRNDTGETEPARPDAEAALVPGPTGSLEGRPTEISTVAPVRTEVFQKQAVKAAADAPAPKTPAKSASAAA